MNKCKDCKGTGMVQRFEPAHNVGNYWEFCECPVGEQEEYDQYAYHYGLTAKEEMTGYHYLFLGLGCVALDIGIWGVSQGSVLSLLIALAYSAAMSFIYFTLPMRKVLV